MALISGANQLRDVFHAHPAHSDKVLRWRPKIEEVITIDVPRLDAAREHFEYVLIEPEGLLRPPKRRHFQRLEAGSTP